MYSFSVRSKYKFKHFKCKCVYTVSHIKLLYQRCFYIAYKRRMLVRKWIGLVPFPPLLRGSLNSPWLSSHNPSDCIKMTASHYSISSGSIRYVIDADMLNSSRGGIRIIRDLSRHPRDTLSVHCLYGSTYVSIHAINTPYFLVQFLCNLSKRVLCNGQFMRVVLFRAEI